jgi:FtsH-binding integral membrane protein
MSRRFGEFGVNLQSILAMTDLQPRTLKHVQSCYTQLFACFGFSVLGALCNIYRLTLMGFEFAGLVSLVCMMGVAFTPQTMPYRKFCLFGYTFFQGITLGSLNNVIPTQILLHALVGTLVIFGGFSISALFAPSRKYLYLGGMLSAAMSLMFWNNLIVNGLMGYRTMTLEIYFGLLVFCGYVLFDTQLMIAKAESGVYDVEMDCLNLWVDLVAIFIRIARIMQEKEAKRNKKRND